MTKSDSICSSGALLSGASFLSAFGLSSYADHLYERLNLIGVITAFTARVDNRISAARSSGRSVEHRRPVVALDH